MKLLRFAMLLFIVVCTTPACKKSNSDDSKPVPGMSFKLNGKLEQSNITPAAQLYTSNNVNIIQIVGKFNDTEAISLSVNNPNVGTYDVVKNNLTLTYSTQSDYNYAYLATSGSVTITSLTSTTVTGTFQFTGTNGPTSATKKITEGKFSTSVTKI